MGAQRFRKRPIEVEAHQWTGDNEAEIQEWISWPGANGPGSRFFNALDAEDRSNCDDPEATAQVYDKLHSTWVLVFTGQWVIRGVEGELYPIKESVLASTYEPAGVEGGSPEGLATRVADAIRASREFQAGAAFGVPVDGYEACAQGMAAAALRQLASEGLLRVPASDGDAVREAL